MSGSLLVARRVLVVVSVFVLLPVAVVTLASPARADTFIYASPDGGGEDCTPGSPCLLEQALANARAVERPLNSHVRVRLQDGSTGGEYRLSAPVVLTADDSGSSDAARLIIEPDDGASPKLYGSVPVEGWTDTDEDGIWKAAVPAGLSDTRQLYVDGVRATRARGEENPAEFERNSAQGWNLPSSGLYAGMSGWANLTEVEFGHRTRWKSVRCPLASVDTEPEPPAPDVDVAVLATPCWPIAEHEFEALGVGEMWVESAFELLDVEGEWYLDRTGDVAGDSMPAFYYKPAAAVDPNTLSFEAPVLESLLDVAGVLDDPDTGGTDEYAPVQYVTIGASSGKGLEFRYTTWLQPNSSTGYVASQGGMWITQGEPNPEKIAKSKAALTVQTALNVVVERNVFFGLGGAGASLDSGTKNSLVRGNVFQDVSSNGIQLGNADSANNAEGFQNPSDTRRITEGNTASNNFLNQTGAEFFESAAIMTVFTRNEIIEHNEIFDTNAYGISSDLRDCGTSIVENKAIRFNDVSNWMRVVLDGGAFYSWCPQPGSSVTENYFHHHNFSRTVDGFVGSTIYHDILTSGYTDTGNVVAFGQSVWGLVCDDCTDVSVTNNYTDHPSIHNGNPSENTTSPNFDPNADADCGNRDWANCGDVTEGFADDVIDNAGLEPAFADIRPPGLVRQVQNSDFELGSTSGWLEYQLGGDVTSGDQRSGNFALELPAPTASEFAWLDQTISVRPGETYTVTAHVKVEGGGSVWIGVSEYDGGEPMIEQEVTSSSYQQVEIQFAAGDENTTAVLNVLRKTGSGGSGNAHVDDFTITVGGGSSGSSLDNGDFEAGVLGSWANYNPGAVASVVGGGEQRNGDWGLHVPASAGGSASGVSQTFSVDNGSYTVSCWLRTGSTDDFVEVAAEGYSGGGDYVSDSTNASDWELNQVPVTVTTGQITILIFRPEGTGTGDAYADDCTLT